MCDAARDNEMHNLARLKNRLTIFGYTPTVQYLNDLPMFDRKMTPDEIQSELGFYYDVPASIIGTYQVLKWYSYLSILKKARVLRKPFVIFFAEVSSFTKDIRLKWSKSDVKYIMDEDYIILNEHDASQILKNFYSNNTSIYSKLFIENLTFNEVIKRHVSIEGL